MNFPVRDIERLLWIVAILVFSACAIPALAFGSVETQETADAARIVQIEKDFAEMQITKDEKKIAAVAAVMSDELYWSHPASGVATKTELIEAIRSKDYVVVSTTFQPFLVKIYGSTAIVHCINSSTGTYKGKDISGTFVSFDVFEKQNGRWVWIAFEGGKVGDKLADKIICNGSICSPNQPGFSFKR
jgi:hypothetical protein